MSYSGKFKDKNNNLHPVTSVLYGTCDTAAATAAKVVTCTDFDTLMTGVTIRVKFANANTAASPTVNINSTGAKSVYRFGSTAPVDGNSWNAGEVVELVYDGTSFFMTGADDIAAKQNATDNSLDTEAKTIVGAINEHEGDIDSLKSGFTALDNEVNGSATTYPYADVITINDAVPANLADCSVKVEPVQDLHGQSKPYVGGAGKNKLPLVLADIKTLNTDGTWSGNVYSINDGTITVNTDSDGNVVGIHVSGIFSALTYFVISPSINTTALAGCLVNGLPDSQTTLLRYRIMTQSSTSATQDITWNGDAIVDNGDNLRFAIRIADTESSLNASFYPMIRLSTETDATFAPYTNICPISGHTEAVVTRDGKNLIESIENGTWNTTTQTKKNQAARARVSNIISVFPTKKYTFSIKTQTGYETYVKIDYYAGLGVASNGSSDWQPVPYTCTIPDDAKCVTIEYGFTTSTEHPENYTSDAQFELGQTATTYVPYVAGKTYTLALGDTIYGGTVDFETGVMRVTDAIQTFDGTENWQSGGSTGNNYRMALNVSGVVSTGQANAFSNELPYLNAFGTDTPHFYIYNSKIYVFVPASDDTEFKAYLASNPLQICYELATPTTIQLTPQQIQLLQGQNTLYASTGDISVTVNGVSGAIGKVQTQANATDAAVAQLAADIAEQLPDAPTTDGAYVLTVTVADGAATYSWESAE